MISAKLLKNATLIAKSRESIKDIEKLAPHPLRPESEHPLLVKERGRWKLCYIYLGMQGIDSRPFVIDACRAWT